jgi:hypothetical protein
VPVVSNAASTAVVSTSMSSARVERTCAREPARAASAEPAAFGARQTLQPIAERGVAYRTAQFLIRMIARAQEVAMTEQDAPVAQGQHGRVGQDSRTGAR